MKKVLLVGYHYTYEQGVAKKYKDVLFFPARHIEDNETAERIVELTSMFDSILIMGDIPLLAYEVAAVMLQKEILHEEDYPIEEKEA